MKTDFFKMGLVKHYFCGVGKRHGGYEKVLGKNENSFFSTLKHKKLST